MKPTSGISAPLASPLGWAGRLARFMGAVFSPRLYGSYALLWVLALEGSLAVLAPSATWSPDVQTGIRVLSVWLTLFYLRMADEQKDLDYDRVHNPDRPLVRGEISHAELRVGMALIAVLLLVLNLGGAPLTPAILLFDLGYALLLMFVEGRSAWFRDSLLVNLFATYPVQLLLSLYVALSLALGRGESASLADTLLLILAFACAFLHLEFARKTRWQVEPGTRVYSDLFGPRGSAAVAFGLALAAELLALAAFRPWTTGFVWASLVPWLALGFAAFGAFAFLGRRAAVWPKPLAFGFLLVFYAGLILQAVARGIGH
ncbi:hypothetical protein [Pseudomonas sp. RIT-PI-AD]|uniref:hypothetical protein n=1 Tax=Pseudomonas sp. RIT-PI-AD TaxID=3035294 RepID=UPI0021D9F1BB|nr:hypothetical protein [Pseudomonas sp. RIT-PI-AD]